MSAIGKINYFLNELYEYEHPDLCFNEYFQKNKLKKYPTFLEYLSYINSYLG